MSISYEWSFEKRAGKMTQLPSVLETLTVPLTRENNLTKISACRSHSRPVDTFTSCWILPKTPDIPREIQVKS